MFSAYTMDQRTRHSTQGQSAPVTDDIVKLEPGPWSIKEVPPDQPSAVYSTAQPMSDNTSGSLLSQNRSHVCQRCSAVFMLSRSMKVHLEIFHGETLHSEIRVAPRLHDSANTDKKLEPPWSMKEEPQDQPSAVYSTVQPVSDNTSGSLLSLGTSHECQHCFSSFVLFSSLELHMVTFHGETLQDWFPMYCAYKCDDIGNQHNSVTGNTGDSNMKTMKGKQEKVDGKDAVRTDPEKTSRKHMCDVCDRAFARASHLKRHALIHTRPKSFVCDVCSKAFIAASHLKSHKLTHAHPKSSSCDVCGKTFTNHKCLKSHKLTHAYPKSSSCDVCGKTFTNPRCLTSHKLVHAEYKPFVCDVCSKAFAQAGLLKKHKLLHASHKPFVCDVCSKAFLGVSQLKVHKSIHTGNKPFACDVCSKAFTQSCHLKKHKVIHTRPKLVACGVCSKTFLTVNDLNDHKLTHTVHKPFFMYCVQ